MPLLPTLPKMIQTMDRLMMPGAEALSLQPVCLDVEADVAIADMDIDEARLIMAEIDAKSSALLAVLAIILAASTFIL